LAAETSRADVLVVSAGVPALIGAAHVREGAVVVDVGINFVHGKMVGDVDFEAVAAKASAITPVARGVGPVTRPCCCPTCHHGCAADRPVKKQTASPCNEAVACLPDLDLEPNPEMEQRIAMGEPQASDGSRSWSDS